MKPAFGLALALLAAGCLSEGDPPGVTPTTSTPPIVTATPTGPTPHATDDAVGDLVDANTLFARDLLRSLNEEKPDENLFISPFSISTALQMLLGGADGETRAAMLAALHAAAIEGKLDDEARTLLLNLTSPDPNATLEIADSLWIDRAFSPNVSASFVQRARDAYLSDVFTRDFADDATVDDVNAWASDKTHGKIPKVIEKIADDEIMFLLNAVYFKGGWSTPFNETCTHDADFTRDDGRVVTVDMMCGGKEHTVSQNAERTLVRLPYGDGRFAMYVALPPEGTKLDDFVAAWDQSFADVRSPYVELEMPRMRLATTSLDLKPALTDLGMGIAFTDDADLTRIADGLLVTRVLHDAVLEVDEKGAVAAAVTTIGVGPTSLPPPPIEVTLDRPFVLAIRDDATGTLLFVGKVHDPTA